MALTSPGVEVQVIDESFYTPAAAGTVPLIFVATAENKANGSGTGTAAGTLAANAGRAYLITSQRELVDTFGDPLFYSDTNGNMIHGSELNEYGLQAAYSALGVSNRAFVVRADIDLAKLAPTATAPGGEPADGAWWFDTAITAFGVQQWNGNTVANGGQSFTTVTPIVITDVDKVTGTSTSPGAPKTSVGAVGDYAVVAITTENKLWYKNSSGAWVGVGTADWIASHATVQGTVAGPTIEPGDTITINGTAVTGATSVSTLADAINTAGIAGVTADVNSASQLEIYSTGVNVVIAASDLQDGLGIAAGEYKAPKVQVSAHTSVPEWKITDQDDTGLKTANISQIPTGSIWIKTTEPNGGSDWGVKQYNGDTELWESKSAPVYTTPQAALYGLDQSGGGANLAVGTIYVKVNTEEASDPLGIWKIYRRVATGSTKIVSEKITNQLTNGSNTTFTIQESLQGQEALSSAVTVTFSADPDAGAADNLAGAINTAGLTNVVASVDSQNRVVIEHKLGGDIRFVDTDGELTQIFTPFSSSDPTSTSNFYYDAGTDGSTNPRQYMASNWAVLSYTAATTEPLSLTEDGKVWYSATLDEVDIMYNNGTTWKGYKNVFSNTDPNGPIVSASKPTEQSDGTPLVENDIWVDTSDLENYPLIWVYDGTAWNQKDNTDQTTENGVVFADARWSTSGGVADSPYPAGAIVDMLEDDYLDPDAPDPTLYPKGMLLWNTRRSGFNVKRFERNYIDVDTLNARTGDESMSNYYPHRWVTASGNNEDGSGTFGRHAQRKTVVTALQAMVNSNQDIRDEESRQFNLIAAPGYPELIGEMISLNVDRRLTAFVIGDTPARLTPDATSLNEWATNVRNAVEDNDQGAVSRDEYMGMYYPWGFTSDNEGNNVVVPPSHMALRTIIINDQIAYPWFAPAGTRRGGVTNATSSGYIDSEGEFKAVSLNTGQRDTLYANNINPITFISGAGLVVFGQKTRARAASALDRVNVARLIVYMRGQLERLARPYLFEPNDKITRDQIKSAAESFLLELVGLRALYDYLVVCDESNNTPSRIDRNELWLDIAVEPVKAIEFIYIPLRVKNTGEIAQLG